MKKVFVVGYSDHKGGVENYIDILSQNISSDKIQIVLSMPTMIIDGVKWVRPKNRHNYVKYCMFWNKFFKKNHFDAVYFNTCDIVGIDVLKFAKKAGVPTRIIHSHASNNFRQLHLIHQYQENQNRKKLHKYATHFLACSKNAGNWMFGTYRSYKLVNNAIETTKFCYSTANREEIRKELNINDQFVVGMVGSLSPVKNPLFGVDVFRALTEKNSNSVLILVGEGNLQENILQLVKEYGLSEKVKMLGRRCDVHKVLSAFDCFLMPSQFEGLPFALVEAQANGLPCVVSDTISKEADIVGNMKFVSLNSTPLEWAEEILGTGTLPNRNDGPNVLKEKGYDIRDNIKYIESILLNEKVD